MNVNWSSGLVMVVGVAALAGQEFALPADWQQRDLEGRWVAYRADLAAHVGDSRRGPDWVRALAAAADWPFLESIAIHEGWGQAGPALQKADAPQWFRVAVWNLNAADSHNLDGARKQALAAGGRGLAWFLAFPAARRGAAAALATELEAHAPGDASGWLPPLDGQELIVQFLDVGPTLQEFGDRQRAEPGVRYVHQIERALRAVRIWNEVDRGHVHKILALTRRPEPGIRTAAFDALMHLAPPLIPWRALLAVATAEGDQESRRLALMAASSSRQPQVVLALFDLAFEPEHPAQATAVAGLQRLYDLGTVQLVERELAGSRLTEPQKTSMRATFGNPPGDDRPGAVATWLEILAVAEATSHPRAASIRAWLTDVTSMVAADVRQQLLRSADEWRRELPLRGSYPAEEREQVARRMRGHLDQLLPARPADGKR
ncbi:MAG: hypothetical protein IPK26_18405 [Planctomycetes bacterium]|nr:hypothetical protein [Planctomycetota bacterium]